MLSRWVRTWFPQKIRPLLAVLASVGLSANLATVLGLAYVVLAGVAAGQARFVASGILLLLGGAFDAIDGELARLSGTASKHGSLLDSVCDHCGDFALFLGLSWFYVPRGALPEVLLIFVILFGSMLASQVRSRAGMLDIDLKDVGIATRFERIIVLVVGLVTQHVFAALSLLAALTTVSCVQRVVVALRPAEPGVQPARGTARRDSHAHA